MQALIFLVQLTFVYPSRSAVHTFAPNYESVESKFERIVSAMREESDCRQVVDLWLEFWEMLEIFFIRRWDILW